MKLIPKHLASGDPSEMLSIEGLRAKGAGFVPAPRFVPHGDAPLTLQAGQRIVARHKGLLIERSLNRLPISVHTLGNILIECYDEHTEYSLLEDTGKYISLGSAPPEIDIAFALTDSNADRDALTAEVVIEGGGPYLGALPLEGVPSSGEERRSEEERKRVVRELTDHVMGLVNRYISERVAAKGRFVSPFFIRYAWRLFDGSHTGLSAPVLMIPRGDGTPAVTFTGKFNGPDVEINSSLRMTTQRLDFRIGKFNAEALRCWDRLVTHLDIFITPPIYAWLQDGDVTGVMPESGDATRHIWRLPENPEFLRDLRSEASFFRLAELAIDQLLPSTEFAPLEGELTDMRELAQQPTLTDSYLDHAAVRSKAGCVYNGRLILADPVITPAPPFAPARMQAFDHSGVETMQECRVMLLKRGRKVMARARVAVGPGEKQWLFYPDPDAKWLSIGGKRYPLTRHDTLYGAFWHAATVETYVAEEEDYADCYTAEGEIFVTEVDNPFRFSADLAVTSGGDETLAMTTAWSNLSEGQFGQFPVYLFSTAGIKALEIDASGKPRSVHPVSKEVMSPATMPLATDRGIIFQSPRGIMLLRGTQLTKLSYETALFL